MTQNINKNTISRFKKIINVEYMEKINNYNYLFHVQHQ
jgi:hypothetical protein